MTAPADNASADGGTPIVTDAMRLARVPFSPGNVFAELREKPTVLWPWLLISIALVAVTFVAMPFQQRAMEIAAQGRPIPSWATMVGLVFVPIAVIAFSCIAAGIGYLVISSLGGETGFKNLLTVNLHASVIGVLEQAVTVVVLRMRGVEAINSLADVRVSLGLDLLLSADSGMSGFLRALMSAINPFSIWGLVICGVGYQVAGKASKAQAWTAAGVGFAIGILIRAFFQRGG